MDNLLFTTGIKNTFEEYCLFSDVVSKERKINTGLRVVLLIPLVCLIVQMIVEERYINLVVTAVICLLFWGPGQKNMLKSLRMKEWRDSDEADDVWYYGFFEDYMEQTTRKGMNRIYYDQLLKS